MLTKLGSVSAGRQPGAVGRVNERFTTRPGVAGFRLVFAGGTARNLFLFAGGCQVPSIDRVARGVLRTSREVKSNAGKARRLGLRTLGGPV